MEKYCFQDTLDIKCDFTISWALGTRENLHPKAIDVDPNLNGTMATIQKMLDYTKL